MQTLIFLKWKCSMKLLMNLVLSDDCEHSFYRKFEFEEYCVSTSKKCLTFFFIKIITPGLTKKIWVKTVFPHLRAKIWENHATISCSLVLLPLLNNNFFTSTLPLKWFVRFPTGFRRVDLCSGCLLLTATVPGAFTEMSEVNHPSVPGCLVCLIFSNYCFVIR